MGIWWIYHVSLVVLFSPWLQEDPQPHLKSDLRDCHIRCQGPSRLVWPMISEEELATTRPRSFRRTEQFVWASGTWHWIQPWKLTWNIKSTKLKRNIIFQTSIFGFHLNFSGCTSFLQQISANPWQLQLRRVSRLGFSPGPSRPELCPKEWFLIATGNGWWFRNPANQFRFVVYPVIYKVLYIPDGAGFLPSTEWKNP